MAQAVETTNSEVDYSALFLANVRARIKRMGISQAKAGQRAGFHYRQISQLLKDTSNPTLSTMIRMAGMVDVPLHTLLDPTFDPWGPLEGEGEGEGEAAPAGAEAAAS